MSKNPELALTDEEAKKLARGIAEVNKHYPIPVMKPEHVAIGALAVTALVIYKDKATAIMARKAREKLNGAAKQPPATGNVAFAPNGEAATGEAPTWFNLPGSAQH